MAMSRRTVETLLDLVEIKLSSMQVLDREDARELAQLENCRRDLLAMRAALKTVRSGARQTDEPASEAAVG
jgi:hypothetical protein